MSGGKRTIGDWIWMGVGLAGIACIGIAAYLVYVNSRRLSPEQARQERISRAKELWRNGVHALDEGRVKQAVADLKAAVNAVDGRHAVYQYDLGRALACEGKKRAAAERWLAAVSLKPTYAAPYLALARWLQNRKRVDLALQYYRAGLALHDHPVPADLSRTIHTLTQTVRPQRQKKIELLKRSLRANPGDVNALMSLLVVQLEQTKVDEGADPAAALRIALRALGKAVPDFDGLMRRQQSAVKDRPGSVVDESGLGVLHLLENDIPGAKRIFEKALGLSSQDGDATLGAALCDLLDGTKDTSRLEHAAELLSPNANGNPVPWLALGAADLVMAKKNRARASLFYALRRDPALPEVYRLLAKAFDDQEGAANHRAALRAYERLFR